MIKLHLFLFISSFLSIITGYEVPRIDRKHFLALKSALRMSQSESEQRKLFIFGLGYVGTSFARYMKNKGWSVCGTCTNVNKAIELRNEGIKTFLFDEVTLSRGQTDVSEDILSSDCVLSTIPPILPNRDLVLEAHSDDLRQAVFKRNLKWIGYLSSTGVYGDCGGAWVKEDRPLKPENEKTRARADVENYWSQLHLRGGLPVHIFRLAGIYGPGRSALDTLLKFPDESLKIPADDTTFVSRIHVDDIMQVLAASMSNPSKGEVYNVADDLPSTRYDVRAISLMLIQYIHFILFFIRFFPIFVAFLNFLILSSPQPCKQILTSLAFPNICILIAMQRLEGEVKELIIQR